MRKVSNKLLHKSCPQCGSGRLYKAGFRYLKNKPAIQPFQCRECGHRFSEGHIVSKTDHRKYLNGEYAEGFKSPLRNSPRAITALKEKRRTGEAAGATEKAKVKGKIVEFAWHLKKQGDSEKTITTYLSILRTLWKNGADLLNPETVKDVLAKLDRSPNTKAVMTAAYTCFLKFLGRSWVPPKYQFQKKIPFIPLESEIDALIAGCGKKTSTILQLLKETAMRVGEALRLKWTDVNFSQQRDNLE